MNLSAVAGRALPQRNDPAAQRFSQRISICVSRFGRPSSFISMFLLSIDTKTSIGCAFVSVILISFNFSSQQANTSSSIDCSVSCQPQRRMSIDPRNRISVSASVVLTFHIIRTVCTWVMCGAKTNNIWRVCMCYYTLEYLLKYGPMK